MTETKVAETEVLTLQFHGALQTVLKLVENGQYTVQGTAFVPVAQELEVLQKFLVSLQNGHLLVVTPSLGGVTDDAPEYLATSEAGEYHEPV